MEILHLDAGHMTKKVDMPIYGKTSSPKGNDRSPENKQVISNSS